MTTTSNRMRPDIDMGPCQVNGPSRVQTASRARVMWENGVLYIARNPRAVMSVSCPEIPTAPRHNGQSYTANTGIGVITFKRRGCTCSYQIGHAAFGALVEAAVPLEGVESASTPESEEDTP